MRASQAWVALKVSPVLASLAFLGRGIERGRPLRGAPCPMHMLGPLMGTVIGPAASPLARDAAEEFFMPAARLRKVTARDWGQWRTIRTRAQLLEDVTALAHHGTCAERTRSLRCSCRAQDAVRMLGLGQFLRVPPSGGVVPLLIPDPTGRTDPWHDTLVAYVSRFRGPGTFPDSKFAGQGEPSIAQVRTLQAHLEVLASAFAGPGRADRMVGLARVGWDPPLEVTANWRNRDRLADTTAARVELRGRLHAAARLR